ncbi:hypothetical protein FRC07_008607 [Ceratobasidium sp. 392]|nr:hypothetical protein FRC07_008607 [Ceratobasidium sp. 392]
MTTIVRPAAVGSAEGPKTTLYLASMTALAHQTQCIQIAEPSNGPQVDFDGIRSGVNLAHRADADRPPVQALGSGFAFSYDTPHTPRSSTSSSMPPPAPFPQRLQPWSEASGFVSGASTLILRPQNWQISSPQASHILNQAQPGYTANHQHYKATRQANAARAYASSKASFENVIVNVDLCRPTNEHSTKYTTIFLFDAIHTKFLKATQDTLEPLTFHLIWDDLILKNKQKMDVIENYANESFMYKSCFKGTRFQANQKFDFRFHMTFNKWEELERAMDNGAVQANKSRGAPSPTKHSVSRRKRSAADCDEPDTNDAFLTPPPPPKRHHTRAFTSSFQQSAQPSTPTSEPPTKNQVVQAIRQQADSSKSCASALIEMGKATYRIQLFPFPIVSWGELIAYTNTGSKCLDLSNLDSSKAALLVVDVKSSLGRGAMKTCNPGCIRFDDGSTDHVALKRPYSTGANAKQILRYEVKSELTQVVNEGLTLLCATSLLELAQSFIQASSLTPDIPYTLPLFHDLRFVRGGLALILQPNSSAETKAGGLSTKAPSAGSYPVEERIGLSRSRPWTKYINNSCAKPTPAILPHSPEMALAVFLQFLQHLQWKLTHGLAFVSDFQGAGHLLSDPQIMTHPSLGDGLFSGGNVGSLFEKFPEQHICNEYCKWYKLGKVDSPPQILVSTPGVGLPNQQIASSKGKVSGTEPTVELEGAIHLID